MDYLYCVYYKCNYVVCEIFFPGMLIVSWGCIYTLLRYVIIVACYDCVILCSNCVEGHIHGLMYMGNFDCTVVT